MAGPLCCKNLVVDCPAKPGIKPLKMSVARYFDPAQGSSSAGVTLLFAHCIGSHKEQWAPTIEEIFAHQRSKPPHQRVREAYAFDRQNHGESAVLNAEHLAGMQECISMIEWADAITHFVRTRLRGHTLISVGHSAGTGCMALTTRDFPLDSLPYKASILVEPMVLTNELWLITREPRLELSLSLGDAIRKRKDSWASRKEALTWMRKRYPWNTWDDRVVQSFVDYGLYQTDPSSPTVTLKTSKLQESYCYPDIEGCIGGMEEYFRTCQRMPFHLIYGEQSGVIDDRVKEDLSDTSKGARLASVDHIADAEHLIPQEAPTALARSICRVIDQTMRVQPHL